MEKDVTYLLCPDKKCKKFWDRTRYCPCESECPKEEELVKIIVCHNCNETIELPGNHSQLQNVGHRCADGSYAVNFRFSGKYEIRYKK